MTMLADLVGHFAPWKQRGGGQRGNYNESDPCPCRRLVQHIAHEERHDRAADAHDREAVGKIRRGRRPVRAAAERGGYPGERPLRLRLLISCPARGVAQDKDGDSGRDQQHAAVDEERRPQRPGRHQPADRRAADPAEQEAASVELAGAPALPGRHAA
jgi:hypothetical protein